MSRFAGNAYHPVNGTKKSVWEGFSWPCFFAGCFWYMHKGMYGMGVATMLMALMTGGLSWLLLPFFANAHYAMELRDKGWLDECQWREQQRAKKVAAAVGSRVAGSVSIADELEKLARLQREGMLTHDELLALKARLVAASREH